MSYFRAKGLNGIHAAMVHDLYCKTCLLDKCSDLFLGSTVTCRIFYLKLQLQNTTYVTDSEVSIVTWLWAGKPRNPVSIPGRSRRFVSSPNYRVRHNGLPHFSRAQVRECWGYGGAGGGNGSGGSSSCQ